MGKTKDQVVMTQGQIKKYEALDRDIYRLCTNAENTLRLFNYTKYLWSPALDESVKEVQYWKSRKHYWDDMNKTLEIVTTGRGRGFDDNVRLSRHKINEALTQAYRTLHQIQKKDCEKRQEFLSELAEKYAQENKITKELAIRELLNHEELREMFRTIRIRMVGMVAP